jgi:hypothetical protein
MKNHDRDLLVLLKTKSLTGEAFDKHIECLHKVLLHVENNDAFCTAHHLATRMKLTSKKKTILKAIAKPELKPYHFLINKN